MQTPDISPLDQEPQYPLGVWPTPLQLLPNLTAELGGPRIWVKRDDNSGLAGGGNKTRKLEFLLGRALAEGYDSIITFGAVQSNHARQTAAACAKAGIRCHLILTRQVTRSHPAYESGGNVLLDRLLGADVHLLEADDREGIRALIEEIRTTCNPYIVPAGGSNATGALGYVRAAVELHQQCQEHEISLSSIVHASSSAGTQAGLLCGFTALNADVDVLGINVYHQDPDKLIERVHTLVSDVRDEYPHLATSAPLPVRVNHAYIADGYGQPDDHTVRALETAACLEGLLLDPVYSGKGFAALVDQVAIGNFQHADDVIFIHTGGAPAINVYEDIFQEGSHSLRPAP